MVMLMYNSALEQSAQSLGQSRGFPFASHHLEVKCGPNGAPRLALRRPTIATSGELSARYLLSFSLYNFVKFCEGPAVCKAPISSDI
jgi:hypothetical protein